MVKANLEMIRNLSPTGDKIEVQLKMNDKLKEILSEVVVIPETRTKKVEFEYKGTKYERHLVKKVCLDLIGNSYYTEMLILFVKEFYDTKEFTIEFTDMGVYRDFQRRFDTLKDMVEMIMELRNTRTIISIEINED